MEKPIEPYRALDPTEALEKLEKAVEEIKSGKFKVVDFTWGVHNEILIPHESKGSRTKPTGQIQTINLKLSNVVVE